MTPDPVPTLRRRAARVAVVDAGDRVLLLRAGDPTDPAAGAWWELPGGGIDPGEDSGAAARRELWEETGLTGVAVGRATWRHHVEFDFAGYHFDQHEWIHLGRLAGHGAAIRAAALEHLEVAAFTGHRWVPVGELTALAAGDRIIPHWLPERLPAALAADPPGEPIDLGEQSTPRAVP